MVFLCRVPCHAGGGDVRCSGHADRPEQAVNRRYDYDVPGTYVRIYYRVPAYIGSPVVFTWRGRHSGRITGFSGSYLRIKFDDWPEGDDQMYHPTWEIEYPLVDISGQHDVPSEGQSPLTQETRTP